jgi:hypothetical protein
MCIAKESLDETLHGFGLGTPEVNVLKLAERQGEAGIVSIR